jgi:hypothetical protein
VFHRGGEGISGFVPGSFEQFLGGQDQPRRGEQTFEQCELLGTQLEPPAGAEGRPASRIQHDVAAAEGRWKRRGGTARQGADPGDQFGEGERLGQVVVGAETQPVDPVLDRAGRGQHQHPGLGASVRKLPADVVTADAWQVAVENHHVVPGGSQPINGSVAIQYDVHGHPLATQPGADRASQYFEVLDHQNSHRGPPVRHLTYATMPGGRSQPGRSRRDGAATGCCLELAR